MYDSTKATTTARTSNMTDPTHLNLLPGYESDEEEVEHSPVFQHTSPPNPNLTSLSTIRSSSPEPPKDTSTLTSPDLLPGYESDEEEFQAVPAVVPVPRIVVQSPTPFPCSPPASITSTLSSESSTPTPTSSAHVHVYASVPAPFPAAPNLPSTAPTKPPLRRSQRLIERQHTPVGTTPLTPPAPAPCVQRTIQVHRRTAPSGFGVPIMYQNTPLINMARIVERNLEASVEMAEAFLGFVGVGKQGHRIKDVAKMVVEKKLEEVSERFRKRKVEEDDGDTEVGEKGERVTKKLKTEDE